MIQNSETNFAKINGLQRGRIVSDSEKIDGKKICHNNYLNKENKPMKQNEQNCRPSNAITSVFFIHAGCFATFCQRVPSFFANNTSDIIANHHDTQRLRQYFSPVAMKPLRSISQSWPPVFLMSSLSDNEITLFDPKRNSYSIRNFDSFKILDFVK